MQTIIVAPLGQKLKNKSKYEVLFIQNLIRIRHKRCLTQYGFAVLLEVTTQMVKDWENYRSFPNYTVLLRIGAKLDVKIDEMGRSELLLF